MNNVKELREITGAGMLDCKKALDNCNGNLDEAIDYLREKGISKAAKKESRIAAEGLSKIFINNNTALILEMNSETDFVAKNEEFINLINKIGEAILNSDANTMDDALNLEVEGTKISDLIINATAKIGEKITLRRFEKITKNDNEVFGDYLHMGGKIAVLTVVEGANTEVAKDVSMQSAAMNAKYIKREDVPSEVVEKEKKVLTEQAVNEGKPKEIAEKMVNGRIQKFYKEICLEEQSFIKDGDIDIATYVKNNNGKIVSSIRYQVGEGIEKKEDNFAEEVMSQIKNS